MINRPGIILLLILTQTLHAYCQGEVKPRTNPLDLITLRYKDAYIKITYSQPSKKGREIFGNLIPYGKVWETGANETTEITTTKDILFDSKLLKAGTYSLFTIPNKDKWTIIINSDVGLWGAYNYNVKLDVFRFEATVQTIDTPYESFTMMFDQRNELADLLILWDKTKISIPIKFIN